jgi:hypothetical protein
MKVQLLVEFDTGEIIAIAVDLGKTHDFQMLKHSRFRLYLHNYVWLIVATKALPNAMLVPVLLPRSPVSNLCQNKKNSTISY